MTQDDADTLRVAASVLTSFHKGSLADQVLEIAAKIERSVPRSKRRKWPSAGVIALQPGNHEGP